MKCVICGTEFKPRSSAQKTCGNKECQRKLHLQCVNAKNIRDNKSTNYHELFKINRRKIIKAETDIETMDQCKHPDCKYRGRFDILICCNYLYKTNKIRGCKISECDKYEPKE